MAEARIRVGLAVEDKEEAWWAGASPESWSVPATSVCGASAAIGLAAKSDAAALKALPGEGLAAVGSVASVDCGAWAGVTAGCDDLRPIE